MFDYREEGNRANDGPMGRLLGGTSRLATVFVVAALSSGAFATAALSASTDEGPTYEKSLVFFELNHSDGEIGLKAEVEGDGWQRLSIDGPGKDRLLDVQINGRLKVQGLSELSIETTEPSFDDMPAKAFFARFPEGAYAFLGSTLDGKKIGGTAMLSHVMPAPPGNLKISGLGFPKDCDDDPIPMAAKPVMISWNTAATHHPDFGKAGVVKIDKYEVVLKRYKPTTQEIKIELAADATSYRVPAGFIAGNTGFPIKFEIVVQAESGNQTVFESCFAVMK